MVNYSADRVLNFLKNKPESFWLEEGRKRSLSLFKLAARRVPAYKDFLKKNRIKADKIKSWKDFQQLPAVSKNDYLRLYPLEKLCWDGTLNKKSIVFTATSGSTGEPFYFPREKDLDWQYSLILEEFLRAGHTKGPTLVIIGFGLGVWIGGIITYKAFEIASQRGPHPISILTPGINKAEIFNALQKLSPHFKNTILVGYPPFVKDIIDESVTRGINLKKINLRLLFAAEAFSDNFREYLVKKAGIKNPFFDTLNIYGSADIGAMAFETPLSIFMRNMASKNTDLFKGLFSDVNKMPTLAQFNPLFVNFENRGKEILLTGNNTIPLIRYAIGDHGGVLNFSEVLSVFNKLDLNLKTEAQKGGITKETSPKLPFVYIYERKDLSVKLYGAIIYPEHIREALQHVSVSDTVTGKFVLITKYDNRNNQYLEINCELNKGERASSYIHNQVKKLVVDNLLKKNAEYRNNFQVMSNKLEPRLAFWAYEDNLHFKPGTKQKWVKTI